MNHLLLIALVLLVPILANADDPDKVDHLDSVVSGLLSSREIVIKDLHPVSYLTSLKVRDSAVILNGWQRYELARMLLDCHHLCQALMHQGYMVTADAPIIKLAQSNFAGFEICIAEAGYDTNAIADYFERGSIEWGVDSTFATQAKKPAEQNAAGQPATRSESK